MNISKVLALSSLASACLLAACESNEGPPPPAIPPRVLNVTVSGDGAGTVSSDPAGITDCSATGGTCSAEFEDGATVTLTATPGVDSSFFAWAGTCTPPTEATCTVEMDADRQEVAIFRDESTSSIGDTFALTDSGRLLSFNRANPGTVTSNTLITGLVAGDEIVALDFRPSNGVLYGLGRNDAGDGRLYVIATGNARATEVAVLSEAAVLVGSEFGMFFDPQGDELRISDSTGRLYAVEVTSGTVSSNDEIANAPAITALAGTNAFAGTQQRTLYALDATNLYMVTLPATLEMVGALGAALPGANGFDVDAVNGVAWVASSGPSPQIQTLDLSSGALGGVSTIGGAGVTDEVVRGLAIPTPGEPQVFGICAGVSDANSYPFTCNPGTTLVRFNVSNPGSYSVLGDVTGIANDGIVIAMDTHPATNVIYAVTAPPDVGGTPQDADGLYTINHVTRAATFVASLSNPLPRGDDEQYGMDFHPGDATLRIMGGTTGSGGAPATNVTVDAATGAVTALAVHSLPPYAITSTAFSNNNSGADATDWYAMDSASNRLFTIDADTGTDPLANPGRLTFETDLDFNASNVSGFEILSAGSPPANNVAYLTETSGGSTFLRQLNLTDGSTTLIGGAIGSLSGFSGEVVGLTAPVGTGAEFYVASTAASPDARLLGFQGADPATTNVPVPGTLSTNRLITGLTAGETILAMDFRLATGQQTLFVLARGAADAARLYTLNTGTGAASTVGLTGDLIAGAGTYTLLGTHYGMDVDPTNNNLRIVSDVNENLSVNPTTAQATVVDDLAPLNGVINSIAYRGNFDGSTDTELLLFDVNAPVGDRVARINETTQIFRHSVDSSLRNASADESSWDILGGHDGVSVISEANCPTEDLICFNTPGFSIVYHLDLATDTAAEIGDGEVGVDNRQSEAMEDTRILLQALTVRFPD